MRAPAADEREHVRKVAQAIARRSYGKLIAFLAARGGDVPAAEDALAEAFASALATWPERGCPSNPEGWLLTVSRRRLIDLRRRERAGERAGAQLQLLAEGLDDVMARGGEIPDRRLALMFACAHPAIDTAIRAPLILQVLLGLDAVMIASTFLASPAAMRQRLVRAKQKIRQAGIPLEVPTCEEIGTRLGPVLDAIYAAFTYAWAEPGGIDLARRGLADEALFLGRLVTELLPQQPEPLGLLALMQYAEARRRARRSDAGEYVPLDEQDPSLWDARMIAAAEELLLAAARLGAIGRFQLEAALQSAHVHRRFTGEKNWGAVLELYDALLALHGSPVVAINRALAVAEVHGAHAAFASVEEVAADARMSAYQPYWAVRADLLARMGMHAQARKAYEMAIGLESDAAVRRFLQGRQAALPP